MKYIESIITGESEDFIRGFKSGVYAFSWWGEGSQRVGSCNVLLEDINKIIDDYLKERNKKIK